MNTFSRFSERISYGLMPYSKNITSDIADSKRFYSEIDHFLKSDISGDTKIAIYGTAASGMNTYRTIAECGYERNIVCFLDQSASLSSTGLIRHPSTLGKIVDFDIIVICVSPFHYKDVLQNISDLLSESENTKIHLTFLPDFRSEGWGYENMTFPAVLLNSYAYNGYLSWVFMDMLGAYNYDYKVSNTNNIEILRGLRPFQYVYGTFKREDIENTLTNSLRNRTVFYYRDLKDLLYLKLHSLRTESRIIRKLINDTSELEMLKKIFYGYEYNDGLQDIYITSVAEDAKDILRWLNCKNVFSVCHDDLTNDTIPDVMADAFEFIGLNYTTSLIDKAIICANRMGNINSFEPSINAGKNVFDQELDDMFESEIKDLAREIKLFSAGKKIECNNYESGHRISCEIK